MVGRSSDFGITGIIAKMNYFSFVSERICDGAPSFGQGRGGDIKWIYYILRYSSVGVLSLLLVPLTDECTKLRRIVAE